MNKVHPIAYKLGTVSFVIGAAGAVVALVPILGMIAIPAFLAGAGIAVTALLMGQRGVKGTWCQPGYGAALSGIAVILSVISTVILGMLLPDDVAKQASSVRAEAPAAVLEADGRAARTLDEDLHNALWLAQLDRVQELLDAGADVNAPGDNGWRPLHRANFSFASPAERYELLSSLLDHGADVNAVDDAGDPPLVGAITKCPECGILLLDRGAVIDRESDLGARMLCLAIAEGHSGLVQRILREGVSLTAKTTNELPWMGVSAIHCASRYGQPAMLEFLLASGVDIHETDGDRRTALHWAAEEGHETIVKTLLTRGAAVNARASRLGETPLHVAVRRQQADVVRLLIAAGANPDIETANGHTVFQFAAIRPEMQDLLYELTGRRR